VVRPKLRSSVVLFWRRLSLSRSLSLSLSLGLSRPNRPRCSALIYGSCSRALRRARLASFESFQPPMKVSDSCLAPPIPHGPLWIENSSSSFQQLRLKQWQPTQAASAVGTTQSLAIPYPLPVLPHHALLRPLYRSFRDFLAASGISTASIATCIPQNPSIPSWQPS
jgi:hypothetical protein